MGQSDPLLAPFPAVGGEEEDDDAEEAEASVFPDVAAALELALSDEDEGLSDEPLEEDSLSPALAPLFSP